MKILTLILTGLGTIPNGDTSAPDYANCGMTGVWRAIKNEVLPTYEHELAAFGWNELYPEAIVERVMEKIDAVKPDKVIAKAHSFGHNLLVLLAKAGVQIDLAICNDPCWEHFRYAGKIDKWELGPSVKQVLCHYQRSGRPLGVCGSPFIGRTDDSQVCINVTDWRNPTLGHVDWSFPYFCKGIITDSRVVEAVKATVAGVFIEGVTVGEVVRRLSAKAKATGKAPIIADPDGYHNHVDLQAHLDRALVAMNAATGSAPNDKRSRVTITGIKTHPRNTTQLTAAAITQVTQVNPTDGGNYTPYSGKPVFPSTSDPAEWWDDINQNGLADCWFLSALGSLSNTAAGQDLLRHILQPELDASGNPIPGRMVGFFNVSGVPTQVHATMDTAGIQNLPDADGNTWATLLEKMLSLVRTGADTFHSMDNGFYGNALSFLWCNGIAQVNTVAKADAARASGGAAGLATSSNVPSGFVANHALWNIGNGQYRNPWGSNSGGMLLVCTITDANLGSPNYMTLTISAPFVTPSILPPPKEFPTASPAPTAPTSATVPNPPTGISVGDQTQTSAKVYWTTPGNCDGFNIYRDTVLVGAQPANSQAFQDTGLLSGAVYTYAVTAFNSAGESAPSISKTVKTLASVPPPTPLPPPTIPQPFYTGTVAIGTKTLTFLNGILESVQ